MTPDEARKLLGGYATGSLTEAERTALFQAALEDQDLFDELAGEQVLKEVLDEPGARQRLIAALEPPRKQRAWLWVTAAATVAIAVVIGIVVSNRTPPPEPPQQIAQVLKSPEPVAPTAAVPPVPAPAPVKRKVTPPVAEPQAKLEAPAAAPAPMAMRAQAESVKVSAGFEFAYEVRADGSLQITPAETGFLSVTASGVAIFPGNTVAAFTPVRITIPPGATSLVIAFSRTPGITGAPVRRDEASGTVTDQDPPNGRILIQLFLTPATR